MQQIPNQSLFSIKRTQPLIGVEVEEHGQQVTYYFGDEKEADKTLTKSGTQGALGLAGTWSDLDWQDIAEALEQIRHKSKPSQPIGL